LARWTLSKITSIPTVWDGDSGDPVWYPLQHALGIDTFGVNVFVASRADQVLVEDHNEQASGQEELYLVLEGRADFVLDGEVVHLGRGDALAITDPSVRRSASAVRSGTALLIVGASSESFESSWNPAHFSDIPRPE
jgi:hypothetical protein